MKSLQTTKLSILGLAPVVEGSSIEEAFERTLDLAQHAERWGYHRFWLAEHHNMPGVASSATSVVIGYVAAGTKTIRVGAGGIMLPNHSPLVIAEQFGTLEAMYPGRIDLGLGRAPGTDLLATRALRRGSGQRGEDFPALLHELRQYFNPTEESRETLPRAVPGEGYNIPIWLLGSSGFSAQLAAELGLPFAFASHFAPDYLIPALNLYVNGFKPSRHLCEPYSMVGVNVIVADTDEEAQYLATSFQQSFLGIIRNERGLLKPPVTNMDELWDAREKKVIQSQLSYTVVGNKETVRKRLDEIITETQADELIVASQVYDHQATLYSYQLLAEISEECRKAASD